MRLSEIISGLEGQLLRDGEFDTIALATDPCPHSFLTFLENEKFIKALDRPEISCIFIKPELAGGIPEHIKGVFVCKRPKQTLYELHNRLSKAEEYAGKSFSTRIGKNCDISPMSYIDKENVIIGDNVIIEPFVHIKGKVTIGDHVIIRAGSVIGAKAFSFYKDEKGLNQRIVDVGGVKICDHAEIYDLVHITSGIFPWENTVVGENSKIAEQVLLAHHVRVGKNCLVTCSKIAGNTCIGDNAWIGIGAVVSNRVNIGDGARVSIGAVVTRDVPAGETVTGNFAIPHQRFMKNLKESIKE